jgi:hypothetical protein
VPNILVWVQRKRSGGQKEQSKSEYGTPRYLAPRG